MPDEEDINCAASSCTWTWIEETPGYGCCRTYECQGFVPTNGDGPINFWVLVDQYKSNVDCTDGSDAVCGVVNDPSYGATYTSWDPGMGMGMQANCDCQCTGTSIWQWTPTGPDPNSLYGACLGTWELMLPCSFEEFGCVTPEPGFSPGSCGVAYYSIGCTSGTCSFPPDPPPPSSWSLTTPCPTDCGCGDAPDRDGEFNGETVSVECACDCGDDPPDPDPDCDGPAPSSVTKLPQMMPNLGKEAIEGPCSQEECETHVSTWMAEASGKPNEEGLYKVKWILLDGCPGACCSDQPTQPEFVKKSTLVDAPCKCGCS